MDKSKTSDQKSSKGSKRINKKVRYAIVGLGHIAQAAVLPGFEHAQNSELTTLFSNDPLKQKQLAKRYKVSRAFAYADYAKALQADLFDAVYIALPNSMHRDFAIQAMQAGKHVLCEKPLATSSAECRDMIRCAKDNKVKLMTAYRLHFQEANMEMVKLVHSGKIGEAKLFTSSFSYQVKANNIRLRGDLGGGALYDIGIYCINAARYLFRAEPWEVLAVIPETTDLRFSEVEASVSAIMRFPQGRIAQFSCSFALAPTSWYEIVGTKGSICVDNSFGYNEDNECEITVGERTESRTFKKSDQFGAELLYFSDCILSNKNPEPSGVEGAADIRIIEAIYESAKRGQAVQISPTVKPQRPSTAQVISKPAPKRKPQLIHAQKES